MRLSKRVSLLTATLLAGSSLVVGTTPAQAAAVIVVDNDGKATPSNCNALAPAPSTINAGIALANPGDTVKVCPGEYNETVLANKDGLRLIGPKVGLHGNRVYKYAEESTVQTLGTSANALEITANNVAVDGFTFQNSQVGVYTSPLTSGYLVRNNIIRSNVIGVYWNSEGTTQSRLLRNKIITNNNGLNDPSATPGAGNGVYSDQGLRNTLLQSNYIGAHRNSGILLTTTCTFFNENITIQFNNLNTNYSAISLFDNNTNVNIRKNRTNDFQPSNDLQWGSAIFVGGLNTNINIGGPAATDGNVVNNSPYSGIAIRDAQYCSGPASGMPLGGVLVGFNTVTNNDNNGIDVTTVEPGRVTVTGNVVRNNGAIRNDLSFPTGADGIYFGASTSGNTISNNTASGNGQFDCNDDSSGAGTAGTANTWAGNDGVTDDPDGICP